MKAAIIIISPKDLIHQSSTGTDRYKYSAEKIEGTEDSYLLTLVIPDEKVIWLGKYLYVKMMGPAFRSDGQEVWMAPYRDIELFEKYFRADQLPNGDFFYGTPGKY